MDKKEALIKLSFGELDYLNTCIHVDLITRQQLTYKKKEIKKLKQKLLDAMKIIELDK